MRSRALNKRIQIYSNDSASDGYGGYTVSENLIGSSWAKIETAKTSASKLNELGLNDMTFNILVTLRKRNDITYDSINQFFVYRGYRYMFIVSPVETNFNDSFVTLIATRDTEFITEPTDYNALDYTIEFSL